MPLVKLPKKGAAATATAPELKDDSNMSPAANEKENKAVSTAEQIELGGRTYAVIEHRQLRASPKAGIPDGRYPVVLDEGRDGKKIHKAAVNGLLYTIKNFGKQDEVIIKLRESRGGRRGRPAAEADTDVQQEFALDDDVVELIASYRALEPKLDPDAWLNAQLRKILSEEVARLEKLRDGMKKLPSDLLMQLAGADAQKLEKIRAMLAG